jgi:hypothetical protein
MQFTQLEKSLSSAEGPDIQDALCKNLEQLESKLTARMRTLQSPSDFSTNEALRDATRLAFQVARRSNNRFPL